jgi:RNA polymerase sigma-70 factor, ECF subfamily
VRRCLISPAERSQNSLRHHLSVWSLARNPHVGVECQRKTRGGLHHQLLQMLAKTEWPGESNTGRAMSEPRSTDEVLVAAFKESGQSETLNALISRHLGNVQAMVFSMVLDKADTDDLTQEVFVRAIRGISSFRGQCRFSTWLYQITMNTVRRFLRGRRRVPPMPEDGWADRVDSRAFAPEQFAIANELDGELTAAMQGLPTKLRAAIVLTSLRGLDARQAAEVEGCSIPTMHWRVHKARKILEKRLAKYLQ